jgi:hypothetical protein
MKPKLRQQLCGRRERADLREIVMVVGKIE